MCPYLFGACLRCKFDLSGVETSNTTDLEARSNLSRKSALSAAQDNIEELLARGHRSDLEEREKKKLASSRKGSSNGSAAAVFVPRVQTYVLPSGLHLGGWEELDVPEIE